MSNLVSDEDENEEYQPARRRMRVAEPVASPFSMSEHETVIPLTCLTQWKFFSGFDIDAEVELSGIICL